MRNQLVITSTPIPIENVPLGSLIPDFLHPVLDAVPVPPVKPTSADLHTSVQTTYKSLVKNYRKTALKPHLAVLGFDISRDQDVDVIINSTKGMLYELKAPTTWFRQLCANTEIQEWIQKRAKARKAMYFITGYRTFHDARVTNKEKHGQELGGNIDIPLDAIASAAAAGIPLSVGMDASLEGKFERSRQVEEGYTAPGEQIYAIQYRRVAVGWFKSRSADQASLNDKICWKDVITNRGKESEEDMVEADLATALRLGKPTEKSVDEDCEDEYLILLDEEAL
jgi:hypothetical protein